MPEVLTLTLSQDLTTLTSPAAISRTRPPAPAPAPSSLSPALSRSQPLKTEVGSVLVCPQLSRPPFHPGDKPKSLKWLTRSLTILVALTLTQVLISLTAWLPGPSSHMGLLKLLKHTTPGPLHHCSLLLECSSPQRAMEWPPHMLQVFTGHSASTAAFLFLLRT